MSTSSVILRVGLGLAYIYIYIYIYICMYVCMYVCICIYTCIHTCIHAHTHAYIHTYIHCVLKIAITGKGDILHKSALCFEELKYKPFLFKEISTGIFHKHSLSYFYSEKRCYIHLTEISEITLHLERSSSVMQPLSQSSEIGIIHA